MVIDWVYHFRSCVSKCYRYPIFVSTPSLVKICTGVSSNAGLFRVIDATHIRRIALNCPILWLPCHFRGGVTSANTEILQCDLLMNLCTSPAVLVGKWRLFRKIGGPTLIYHPVVAAKLRLSIRFNNDVDGWCTRLYFTVDVIAKSQWGVITDQRRLVEGLGCH